MAVSGVIGVATTRQHMLLSCREGPAYRPGPREPWGKTPSEDGPTGDGGAPKVHLAGFALTVPLGDRVPELRALALPREREQVMRFLRDSDPEDYLLSYVPSWVEGEGHLLLEEPEGWVGLATLEGLGEGEAWIGGLRVARPRRGQGFGGRLLEGVLSYGSRRGLRVFRALVERGNVASNRLLQRHGFRSVAPLTLQSGPALDSPSLSPIVRLGRGDPLPDLGPGWVAGRYGRVDLTEPANVGRFGLWRRALLERWAEVGRLFLSGNSAWLARERGEGGAGSLWVSPLRGDLREWVSCVSYQARSLGLPRWEGFLPDTTEDREAYRAAGLSWAGSWGESVTLYERSGSP